MGLSTGDYFMARSAKRKKTVGTAASMAAMRDAATVRNINFCSVTKLLQTEGSGQSLDEDYTPIIHSINMDASEPVIIGDFMGCFLDVMYLDLICPGYGTSIKLHRWTEVAKDISTANKKRPNIKDTFNKISRRIKVCAKRMDDLIHYEATDEELKYSLYDLVLKVSIDYNIKIKGLLPPI